MYFTLDIKKKFIDEVSPHNILRPVVESSKMYGRIQDSPKHQTHLSKIGYYLCYKKKYTISWCN